MMKCDNCQKKENCRARTETLKLNPNANINQCSKFREKSQPKPMTNGDYLRSLGDEEMAGALNAIAKGLFAGLEMHTAAESDYRDIFLHFLKQPAEVEE